LFKLLDKDKDGLLSFTEFSLLSKGNLKEIKEYNDSVQKERTKGCGTILKYRFKKNVSIVGDVLQGSKLNYIDKYMTLEEYKNLPKLCPIESIYIKRDNYKVKSVKRQHERNRVDLDKSRTIPLNKST